MIESLGSRAQTCQMKGNQLCSCDKQRGCVSTQVQGEGSPSSHALLFSLSGEPRRAAPVSLLQPLCQLHHREHHQSPEPQSHGHRGHVRCWHLSWPGADGLGSFWCTGVMLDVNSRVLAVGFTPNPQAPPPVPMPLPYSPGGRLWSTLRVSIILNSALLRIRKKVNTMVGGPWVLAPVLTRLICDLE